MGTKRGRPLAKRRDVQEVKHRVGDGYTIPLLSRDLLADGNVSTTFRLSDLPVPPRRFLARELTVVSQSDDGVYLVFGQPRVFGEGLRSLVLVDLSHDGLSWILEIVSGEFTAGLRKMLNLSGAKPFKFMDATEEPEQTVSLVANLAVMAYSGREATIDFYHSSAWSIHVVKQGAEEFAVDPVVRIDLRSNALLAMLDELERVKAKGNK